MSTRSLIGIVEGESYSNRTIRFFYCHFDGYPCHVGRTLYENYNTPEKVKELVYACEGGIRSLDESFETTIEKENLYNDMPTIVIDYIEFFDKRLNGDDYGAEYFYVYNPSWSSWTVFPKLGYELSYIAETDSWKKY